MVKASGYLGAEIQETLPWGSIRATAYSEDLSEIVAQGNSKSNDIEVTSYALSLKNEIEKVREQVQNLE